MRIATWNINSLRLRMPMLGKIFKELEPDVVCLQESKTFKSTIYIAILGYHPNEWGFQGIA